jgi:hypothetical protein
VQAVGFAEAEHIPVIVSDVKVAAKVVKLKGNVMMVIQDLKFSTKLTE